MNGGLLNIWREIGSYLRYGDAKCMFLSGASFGLLFSFVQFRLGEGSGSWDAVGELLRLGADATDWLAIVSFGIAFFVAVLAVIPALSKRLVRVNLLIEIGKRFSPAKATNAETGTVYFRDVSSFASACEYTCAIKKAMNITEEFNNAEKELSAQIWIIARIATSKFIAANISSIAILAGLACAVW